MSAEAVITAFEVYGFLTRDGLRRLLNFGPLRMEKMTDPEIDAALFVLMAEGKVRPSAMLEWEYEITHSPMMAGEDNMNTISWGMWK